MNSDYIYWTFSAAAQSISAFVALLLTGYALVHSLMESARDRDDSLDEVHANLRIKYHLRLTILAWLTGFAIILSLFVAYFNRLGSPISIWLQIPVALVDIASIAGGLCFVISIVNPDKYRRAAADVLSKVADQTIAIEPSTTFFQKFLHLELLVRNYLHKNELYVPSRGAQKMSFSFRQMIEALYANGKIDSTQYGELLEINKYRNLVFHGHVKKVDPAMVKRTQIASDVIMKLA